MPKTPDAESLSALQLTLRALRFAHVGRPVSLEVAPPVSPLVEVLPVENRLETRIARFVHRKLEEAEPVS